MTSIPDTCLFKELLCSVPLLTVLLHQPSDIWQFVRSSVSTMRLGCSSRSYTNKQAICSHLCAHIADTISLHVTFQRQNTSNANQNMQNGLAHIACRSCTTTATCELLGVAQGAKGIRRPALTREVKDWGQCPRDTLQALQFSKHVQCLLEQSRSCSHSVI